MSSGEITPAATLSGEGREGGSHRGGVDGGRWNRGGSAATLGSMTSDDRLSGLLRMLSRHGVREESTRSGSTVTETATRCGGELGGSKKKG